MTAQNSKLGEGRGPTGSRVLLLVRVARMNRASIPASSLLSRHLPRLRFHLRSRLLFCLLSRFNTACCSCTRFKSIPGRKESGKCIIRAPLIYPSTEQRKGVAFALRGVPQAHNYFVSRHIHHSISRHSTYTIQYERSQNSQVLHDTV